MRRPGGPPTAGGGPNAVLCPGGQCCDWKGGIFDNEWSANAIGQDIQYDGPCN